MQTENYDFGGPFPERLLIVKKHCKLCREVKKAVERYNANAHKDERIEVMHTFEPRFARISTFLRKVWSRDAIPTPFIWYEGHVLKWERGFPDRRETLAHLNSLKRGPQP